MADDSTRLAKVLAVLPLDQLEQIVSKVEQLCLYPGHGSVKIEIDNGHPRFLVTSESETLIRVVLKEIKR